MRKENQALWQVRHLWTSLCGDGTWLPCETMVGPNDAELFSDDHVARHLLSLSKAGDPDAPSPGTVNGEHREEHTENGDANGAPEAPGDVSVDADVSMADDEAPAVSTKPDQPQPLGKGDSERLNSIAEGLENGFSELPKTDGDRPKRGKEVAAANEGREPTNGTRPELEHAQGTPITSETLAQAFIHPMFLPPTGSRPDRDLGLPEHEAEDIRRLLALYVQKQEEVCRGATRLHQGLMRAERLRKDVLHWSKAEAHSGVNRDLSDGEDWYDKEEWGLADDLKKGQDEEEEDTTTTGKKTRNRRQ